MKKRRSLEDEIDLASQRATELVGWCARIALHQGFGIGRQRWELVEQKIMEVSDWCLSICMEGEKDGKSPGQRSREARMAALPEGAPTELRIPMRRTPRNRWEEQLKMAEDKGATLNWQMIALACHQVLGFSRERLTRLHQLTLDNIRQLDAWVRENGPEVAMEWLRRCAEEAAAEEVGIDNTSDEEKLHQQRASWEEQMDRYQRHAILREVARKTAKPIQHPGPKMPKMPEDAAEKFAQCRRLAEGSAYRRRG